MTHKTLINRNLKKRGATSTRWSRQQSCAAVHVGTAAICHHRSRSPTGWHEVNHFRAAFRNVSIDAFRKANSSVNSSKCPSGYEPDEQPLLFQASEPSVIIKCCVIDITADLDRINSSGACKSLTRVGPHSVQKLYPKRIRYSGSLLYWKNTVSKNGSAFMVGYKPIPHSVCKPAHLPPTTRDVSEPAFLQVWVRISLHYS